MKTHNNQQGATMVEYGIMVALIAVIILIGATAVGIEANNTLMAVCQVLNDGVACPIGD